MKGELIPTEDNGEFILKPIPGAPLPQHTDQVLERAPYHADRRLGVWH